MTLQSTRRSFLAAAPIAAAAVALPGAAMARPQTDRSAWNTAMQTFDQTRVADDAFTVQAQAAHKRYEAALETVDHIVLRPDPYLARRQVVTTADARYIESARKLVREVAEGKCKLDPIPSLQDHYRLCLDAVAAADARDAKIKSIRDFLDIDAINEEWEELADRAHDARWNLMAMPAPDLPALLWKLEYLLADEGDGVSPWTAQAVEQTVADMRRLLSGEA